MAWQDEGPRVIPHHPTCLIKTQGRCVRLGVRSSQQPWGQEGGELEPRSSPRGFFPPELQQSCPHPAGWVPALCPGGTVGGENPSSALRSSPTTLCCNPGAVGESHLPGDLERAMGKFSPHCPFQPLAALNPAVPPPAPVLPALAALCLVFGGILGVFFLIKAIKLLQSNTRWIF